MGTVDVAGILVGALVGVVATATLEGSEDAVHTGAGPVDSQDTVDFVAGADAVVTV